jgi:HAD superfamily hydrolase (TIGR01509 family)
LLAFGFSSTRIPATQELGYKPAMPFHAAIFDFDETLINLEQEHSRATQRLCRELGGEYDALPREIREESGRRIVDEVEMIRDFFRWDEPLQSLLERRSRCFLDELKEASLSLLPCARDVIRALRARSLRLAIASSGMRDYIEFVMQRTSIDSYFDVVVAGDQVTRAKPDPEAFLIAARKLGVEPSRCVVFEDSAFGVGAAKNAGMFCVAVRNRDARMQQDLSRADRIVASFCELDVAALLSS